MVSYVVLWLLVGILAVIVVALARQIGTLHLRLGAQGALELDDEGPPLGSATAAVTTADVHGRTVVVGGAADSARVLLFATPGCRLCREVLPALHALKKARGVESFLITDASDEETQRAYGAAASHASLVASIDLAQSYAVPGTPYVVVLDAAGVVRAKGTVNTLEQFEGLVDTAERRAQDRRGPA